jgi:ribA/ribD-fused uncharacterized protein
MEEEEEEAEAQSISFLFFWKPEEKHGIFSNCYVSPFTVGEITYLSAEHYLIAEKAKLMGDEKTRALILATQSPEKINALGRQIKPWIEDLWVKNRRRIMFEALKAKFTSTQKLKKKLLQTGDALLVEASPLDRVCGIGLSASHPDAAVPERWRGQNLLGEVLTAVRTFLLFSDR